MSSSLVVLLVMSHWCVSHDRSAVAGLEPPAVVVASVPPTVVDTPPVDEPPAGGGGSEPDRPAAKPRP